MNLTHTTKLLTRRHGKMTRIDLRNRVMGYRSPVDPEKEVTVGEVG